MRVSSLSFQCESPRKYIPPRPFENNEADSSCPGIRCPTQTVEPICQLQPQALSPRRVDIHEVVCFELLPTRREGEFGDRTGNRK